MPHTHEPSLSEVHETVDVSIKQKRWKRLLAFMGPAYLVSVGYMDPGNWATDLQGGAQFGYQLIWVLLMSNLMALLLQSLSARMGIVARRDLAQANREMYPPIVNNCLYILAELAIAATDLAEVLGMAIGIYLLTGLPVLWGVLITVFDTFILLLLQRYGIRKMEAFILALIVTIGVSFLIEIFLAKPDMGEVVKGFTPSLLSGNALYIAVGIIGATVMPHNLYLHSALVQTRKIKQDHAGIKQALRYNFVDSTIALNIAFLINAAILILAASVFYTSGHTAVAKIEDAHSLLQPMLGSAMAPIFFAIALIAAGQSSTITGTLAGQIVMEGYLRIRLNPWLRRLITRLIAIIPAVFVILAFGDQHLDNLLVFSQVALSLQLGFAIIPLIHFVSDKHRMGDFAIKRPIKILAWLVAGVLVFLNARLVTEQLQQLYREEGYIILKLVLSIVAAFFAVLFITMTLLPIFRKRKKHASVAIHGEVKSLEDLTVAIPCKIAVALDFTEKDEKMIAHALSQGNKDTRYILLHIVETVSAKYLGDAADDFETRKDIQRLQHYAKQLSERNYHVEIAIGYKNRITEIVRIVTDNKADMLVMGAHRHRGLKDFIYGQTVEQVRHRVNVPVLIVN